MKMSTTTKIVTLVIGTLMIGALGGGCSCGAEPPSVTPGVDGGPNGPAGYDGGTGNTFVRQPPVVTITSPEDGTFIKVGTTVTFLATATDPEDGALPNTAFEWNSNLDDALGTGSQVVTALATLGVHRISVTVTDSDGNVVADSVEVAVVDNVPPDVTINTPHDDDFILTGTTITFSGNAIDFEDGTLPPADLEWTDNGTHLGLGPTVSTVLPDGDHLITLSAADSQGVVGTQEIAIHVVPVLPPHCQITAPGDGAALNTGTTVTFSATCTAGGGGALPNGNITWNSDVQGSLGAGATVTNALVTLGGHVITVCGAAVDDPTLTGCDSISVVVAENAGPSCSVSGPASVDADQDATFTATATDPEGGALTVAWTSDKDGAIGTGTSITVRLHTSGSHVITCTATDVGGATGSGSAPITVVSPVARITGPADGTTQTVGASWTFNGSGFDAEDGALTGLALSWSSSIAGSIGSGPIVQTVLAAGQHVITLTVTDADGNTGTRSVSVSVTSPPVVAITAPANNATLVAGATQTFTGTATDAEDGTLVPTWTHSALGTMGTGASLVQSGLPVGLQKVTLTATDSDGASASDEISLTVQPLAGQLVTNVSLNGGRVDTMTVDPASGMWIIGNDSNLVIYDPTNNQIVSTFNDQNSPLRQGTRINDLALMADGTLVIATDDGLLVGCNPTTLQNCSGPFRDGDIQLQTDKMRAVLVLPDGRVVVGTDDGLNLSNFTTDQHRRFSDGDGGGAGLVDKKILGLAYDTATGGVWVVTDKGVSLMHPVNGPAVSPEQMTTFTNYRASNGLGDDQVNAVDVAASGAVWFATKNGLTRLVRTPGEVFTTWRTPDIGDNDVKDVAVQTVSLGGVSHEVAWAATNGGLSRVDAATTQTLTLTTSDGLASNNCRSVTLVGTDKVVGTSAGISIYVGQ